MDSIRLTSPEMEALVSYQILSQVSGVEKQLNPLIPFNTTIVIKLDTACTGELSVPVVIQTVFSHGGFFSFSGSQAPFAMTSTNTSNCKFKLSFFSIIISHNQNSGYTYLSSVYNLSNACPHRIPGFRPGVPSRHRRRGTDPLKRGAANTDGHCQDGPQ
jgi:hypothetical protein